MQTDVIVPLMSCLLSRDQMSQQMHAASLLMTESAQILIAVQMLHSMKSQSRPDLCIDSNVLTVFTCLSNY